MLNITTPNTQQKDGNSKLNKYFFSGENGRKFFVIENSGPLSNIDLSLSLSGGTGGFRIFPASSDSISQDGLSVSLNTNQKIAFSVDYNSAWGEAKEASLVSNVNIYTTGLTNIPIIGPTASIEFSFINNTTETKRDIGTLYSIDQDGNYQLQQSTSKITQDETSFGLLRTNPKLTGNVKITVDSENKIWLNSIDAVKELADDRFKRYRITRDSSYAIDVNRFFDNGSTPPELVFSLYQEDALYTSTKRSLSQQYDRFYQYGVSQLKSKFYTEDFSIFTPIYLKKEIPEYFVIFRTDGPINNFSYNSSVEDWSSKVTEEILSKSHIIKVFDLREGSQIGGYLRNIINHPSRTESDITVSYQPNGYTTYNGILYNKGSFAQMGELLYDYFNQENPLISVEEFITLGFERNKVLSSHVINLEFLFSDTEAENYSINRYFGFYVNSIDLAKFTISEGGLREFSPEVNQVPLPRKGVDGTKISQKPFIQKNNDGISVFIDFESIQRLQNTEPSKIFSSLVSSIEYDLSSIQAVLPGNYMYKIENGDTVKFFTNSGLTASATVIDKSYIDNDTYLSLDLSSYISNTPISVFSIQDNLACNFYTNDKYYSLLERIFDNRFIQNIPRFFYIKDNLENLHSINQTSVKYYQEDPFTQQKVIELKLREKSFDMSKLSGFSNILTQADSKLISTRGKSSIYVEITEFLEPNDYLEISWVPGPTNIGYPLRWKVIANDTATNPGEIWPDYTVAIDNIGEYYLSYFNPGDSTIQLEEFVKSIANAFNRFPFKNFEVLGKGNFLYFKSTQEGRISDSAKLTFFSYNSSIKVMGVSTGNTGTVNFIGGSNRFFTRARIDSSIAEGMLENEYISTKGSYSLPKKYSILDENIIFTPYLEEPVYDEDGEKLIDFKNCEKYRIICIEDESQPIQLTFDNKITTFQLFEPTYGILSIMPIRDFDFDFYYSDYSKNYIPELIEYFSRYSSPCKITGISGDIYTFSNTYEFNSYPFNTPFLKLNENGIESPILYSSSAQFKFDQPGATAEILFFQGESLPKIGDSILFLPDEKSFYFANSELAKFKGFLGLSGIISSEDESDFKTLENLWDPSRFTFQILDSEYDRLTENYLKDLVLKSRVVPYITKWVSPQGKDIRDNPYRLNYHRSFGNMNFSPSSDIFITDPRFHTHEWPYLHSIPDKFPIAKYPEHAFSYMFEPLGASYDFSSMKRDWFSEYFSVGYPSEKYKDENNNWVSAKIDPAERYSFFNYQDYDDKTTTLFRGFKFNIRELDTEGIPVQLSQKYNNYRFSVVMETIEDDSFIYESPVEFVTIVNEKWKFILLKIIVRISSYRFTTGRLRYVDLYTLFSNEEIAEYVYDSGSSSLIEYKSAIPTDRKLSTPINFSAYSADDTLTTAYQYYDTFFLLNDKYSENLQGEIVPLSTTGLYSRIIGANDTGLLTRYTSISLPPDNVYGKKTLKIPYTSGSALLKISSLDIPLSIGLPFIGVNWEKYTFYHEGGGEASYIDLRNRLTFAEILKVIEGTSDKSIMNYQIYLENGNQIDTPNFKIEAITPESLTRIYDYYPIPDTDKPQEFYTIPNIGSVLQQQKDLQTIYRYQGEFSPKFKDVIKFWLREDELFSDTTGKDFLFNNTRIGTELKDFSVIKNQHYSKIADSEILRLSTDSGYQPVYPLIGEISIDKRDLFIWNSSWDNNYYRKYTSVSDFIELKGTAEMTEIKSMLGSKVMKVPQQYDLFEFKISKAPSSNLTPVIEQEFTYYENESTAYLQINVYDRLIREMLGDDSNPKAKTEFLKTIENIPGSFSEDAIHKYTEQYLKNNIIDLFEIVQVKFYVLQTGNADTGSIATIQNSVQRPLIEFTTNNSINYTLSESALFNKNYLNKKDIKLSPLGNMAFSINYPIDSRYYTSLSVGVTVKRI